VVELQVIKVLIIQVPAVADLAKVLTGTPGQQMGLVVEPVLRFL
jgi:hypothetical protein